MSFADVKVGDEVIIAPPGYGRSRRSVCKVERVTATQFTAGGYRFRKNSGWQIGGDTYHSARARHATPELIQAVQLEQRYGNAQAKLRQKLTSLDTLWREIDRNHDSHKWAATLEQALPHLTAAAEALKLRQVEVTE